MVSHKSSERPSVQKLIEERGQIGQWLEKLAAATDKPEAARAKVRAGYEKRLAEIAALLQGARKEIEDTLKKYQAAHAELQEQEHGAAEKLAEAEVRHSVGELDDASWKKTHTELHGLVERVREKVKVALDAVNNTGAALASLDPNATVAATKGVSSVAHPVPDGPVPLKSNMSEFIPDPDPVVPTVSQPAAPAPAPKPAAESKPAPPPEPPPAASATPAKPKQTDAFDELAFIKSVTDDESHAPSAARASGMARMSSSDIVVPDQSILDAQAAPQPPRPAPKPTGPAPTPKTTPPPAATSGGGQGGTKTVKCKDCGTMNLPTEWYCEKCGAELSAV